VTLQWVSADLATGKVIADLPSFDGQYPLRTSISTVDTATGVLHLAGAPGNWQRAIQTGNSVLACYDDADDDHAILWAGVVWTAPRSWASDDVTISLATFESIFDRGPAVGDTTYTTTWHRDDVIADVVNRYVISSITGMGISCLRLAYTTGGGPLLPIMDNPPVPNAAFVWDNTDNATPLTRMVQVFGQLGGEFVVTWAWSTDGASLVPTLHWGTTIGSSVTPGLAPAVTFERAHLIDLGRDDDYSTGKGANRVIPYSSGQGSSTPYGAAVESPISDGRPVFEYRYQPAPSISPAALAGYAAQAIKVLAPAGRPSPSPTPRNG
jgi:hypothetical protein